MGSTIDLIDLDFVPRGLYMMKFIMSLLSVIEQYTFLKYQRAWLAACVSRRMKLILTVVCF
jgi:hypothetical protein